jgi:SOS-response transcriptional repressor LexA
MPSTRGERLRDARKKRFKSARAAALELAIPVSTYGAHERAQLPGGRDYSPEDAQRYAHIFGVTPEWLLTGHRRAAHDRGNASKDPQGTSTTKLRVIGYVGTGAQVHLYAVATEDLEEIEAPMLAAESTVALKIRGNSMGSHFKHWFLLYDDLRQRPTRDLIGELCVVALKDGQVLVKQLQQGGAPGQFDLIAQAGPAIRDAAVVWAANVRAMLPL